MLQNYSGTKIFSQFSHYQCHVHFLEGGFGISVNTQSSNIKLSELDFDFLHVVIVLHVRPFYFCHQIIQPPQYYLKDTAMPV